MDKLYKALYDAAREWADISMKPYPGSRFVDNELVALCLAIHNIDMAKRGPSVNQSEELRLFARFGGQHS